MSESALINENCLPAWCRFFQSALRITHNGEFFPIQYPQLTAFINAYYFPEWMYSGRVSLEDVVTALELRNDKFGSFGLQAQPAIVPARIELDRLL